MANVKSTQEGEFEHWYAGHLARSLRAAVKPAQGCGGPGGRDTRVVKYDKDARQCHRGVSWQNLPVAALWCRRSRWRLNAELQGCHKARVYPKAKEAEVSQLLEFHIGEVGI